VIGNFVEVKRSSIDAKSKIKHLAYLGDSQLGKSVNIGAGTITANYDGFHKHQTRIEDGCRIGSNSVLVAPNHLGKEVVTGAGAVVLPGKKVSPHSLLVGIPARVVKTKLTNKK
jgi:bifunctional UDP-N-acetylglucosamine pyrophosphorylase/glucosamine-1-phosphate N-acetyltransferase